MATRKSKSPRPRRPPAGKGKKTKAGGRSWLGWMPPASRLFGENRLAIDLISSQLRSLRDGLEAQVDAASRLLEQRVEHLLAELEQRAARRLIPLFTRAEVVRKEDLAPLESRLSRLEERVSRVVEDENNLAVRTREVGREWQTLRAELTERLAETADRIAEADSLGSAIEELRKHLDSISKEQVAKAVEGTRLHDRVLRLEMRIADISRQHDSLACTAAEIGRRLAAAEGKLADELPRISSSLNDLVALRTEIENLSHHISGLNEVQQAQRCELERVASILRDRENSLDARLGDIIERQKRAGAELAAVAARLRELQNDSSSDMSLATNEEC